MGMLELSSDRSVLGFKRISLARVMRSESSCRNIKVTRVRDDRGGERRLGSDGLEYVRKKRF